MRRLTCSTLLAMLLTGVVGGLSLAEADPPPHLGYGMMMANPSGNLGLVQAAGFDWFKFFVYWNDLKSSWVTLDQLLDAACASGLNLILRVERYHSDWTPIQDHEMVAWEQLFRDMAARIALKRGTCANSYRVALEIWNEPNLSFQWGGQPVDPVRYTQMVQRAYVGAKSSDPNIIIVAGGLAPTGGTSDGMAMNDVTYLQQMYGAGLGGYFDVIGAHNYGFGGTPGDKSWGSGILNFRRAEDIYAVMVANGDGDKQVWATEYGWLLDASEEGHPECVSYWNSIGFGWQRVSAALQADYLAQSYQYADANWPWMGVMVISNLGFSTVPWYPTCEPLRWFAVLRPDGSPRLAYAALQTMAKRTRSWQLLGMDVRPSSIAFVADVDLPGVQATRATVLDTGTETWASWSLITASQGLSFTVVPTSGLPGHLFTVTVDSGGYALGTYTGVITVTASDIDVPESPFVIPVHLYVWPEIRRAYLPLVATQ